LVSGSTRLSLPAPGGIRLSELASGNTRLSLPAPGGIRLSELASGSTRQSELTSEGTGKKLETCAADLVKEPAVSSAGR